MARKSNDRLLSLSLQGATSTDLGIAATTSVPAFVGDLFPFVFPFNFYFYFLCLC